MRKLYYSIILCLAAALPLSVASCSHSDPRTRALIDLRDNVEDRLEELNPGDWIIIAPQADMEKATAGSQVQHIHVLATNVSALRQTLDLMERDGRLGPRLWVCREPEKKAGTRLSSPGTARQRNHLQELLSGRTHFSVDERVIQMQLGILTAQNKVLFIHTDNTLPQSCIGIELDYAGSSSAPAATPAAKPKYQHADLKP